MQWIYNSLLTGKLDFDLLGTFRNGPSSHLIEINKFSDSHGTYLLNRVCSQYNFVDISETCKRGPGKRQKLLMFGVREIPQNRPQIFWASLANSQRWSRHGDSDVPLAEW